MRLIRQHNIINGLLLIAAVSVSSCNSILEAHKMSSLKDRRCNRKLKLN